MFEGLHIDLVLADELPKCPSIFLGGLGCSGDVALMSMQESLDVIFLKSADNVGLGFLERSVARWGFLLW